MRQPATSIFYGGWIPTTDISLSRPRPTITLTDRIVGRVQMFVGEDDPVVPPAQRQAIAAALSGSRVRHEIITYPHVEHGFLCDRRASFNHSAAADAWRRMLQFFAA